jgi:long-chain acyl-CoA synthetase
LGLERQHRARSWWEQIKTFRLIEQRLTAQDEQLTPTVNLKRKLVQQKHAELIESMYSARA